MGDFGIHNMIDNGHLNIFDVGCFDVDFFNCLTTRKIENNNFKELEILIDEIISNEIANICESESLTRKVYSYFQKISRTMGCIKMLEKEAIRYNSVSEYVKDLCKTKRGR